MSVVFEAVLLVADRERLIQCLEKRDRPFGSLSLELFAVTGGSVLLTIPPGGTRFLAREEVDAFACELSLHFSKALAIHYDDRVGIRDAAFFRDGQETGCFGENDEVWVPISDDGNPILDGPRFASDAVPENLECDCIRNGINAGLEAAGFAAWITLDGLREVACGQSRPIWRPGAD